ncbi:hypothetical protein IM511_03790 [Erythrobacteraceae bacterium E2-1 Yellow Sea]|nr:hypothetical protein [Erythrobacteraceae bacterium E2-1 Yellow Sea]
MVNFVLRYRRFEDFAPCDHAYFCFFRSPTPSPSPLSAETPKTLNTDHFAPNTSTPASAVNSVARQSKLSQMADQLAKVSKTLGAIGNKPAIELTPEDIAVQIKRASLDLQHDASDLFRQGRKDLDNATGRLATLVGRVSTEDEKKRQTWLFAGIGLTAGILLWPILPGTIARAMPESWHWPERMARKAVGEPTIIEAGIRLIRTQNPEAFEELMATHNILRDNREALERCFELAQQAGSSVSCSIEIKPPKLTAS